MDFRGAFVDRPIISLGPMPTYDWPMIQQRSGASIESLVATLLRLEFENARQINPSQGDGGIDIIRPTPDGEEVWQVKGFSTALTNSQFRQVESSWYRFVEKNVIPGERRFIRYHLVTPWTPTEERIERFSQLTANAPFPCQWDGEAFLAGLADRHQATMHRFSFGEGALEQFISQKAMLASSPIEHADSRTMMEAIEDRQEAIDDLRETLSDNYFIERGTRSAASGEPFPLPAKGDPAVFHRMTRLEGSRWKYESLVPRSPDAAQDEPIRLLGEFSAEPGSPEQEAFQAWSDWGIPLKNVPARTETMVDPLPPQHRLKGPSRRSRLGTRICHPCTCGALTAASKLDSVYRWL